MNERGKNPPPDHDAIVDAAVAWLAEREDGFTAARAREFAVWRDADVRHAAALARMEKTLGLFEAMPAFRPELNRHFARHSPPRAAPVVVAFRAAHRPAVWVGLGLAAALVLGFFVSPRLRAPAPELRYATAATGYERVRLDDGSTLELNAASAVRTQFTAAERSVRLDAGEAHFSVSHDPARPFVVRAGGVAVRAVGTAFNVRYTATGVEVVVVEGKVRVEPAAASASADGAATAPLVTAGERAMISSAAAAGAPQIERLETAALSEAVAWQRPLVDFADAPLSEIVRRFNLHNRVQLVLADPALGAQRIGGTFALREVEAFVRLLEREGEIAAERRSDSVIVLRRR